ncbi:hypothetical protein ES703_70926 [subsurface metagenome]
MLTDAEYRHAKAGQSALQGKIDAKRKEYDELTENREKVKESGLMLQDEMAFYTNFMHDAFEEYEAAHPPEEP